MPSFPPGRPRNDGSARRLYGDHLRVSFQAANGMRLRHRDHRIRLERNSGTAVFLAVATFRVREGSTSGSVRLESINQPGRFVRTATTSSGSTP